MKPAEKPRPNIPIVRENLFYLNRENATVIVGDKVFKIRQIPIGRKSFFIHKLMVIGHTLAILFNDEPFLLERDPLKLNEKLILKYASHETMLRACYELLKETGWHRKFYYEMFRLTKNDNIITAILKQPIKLIFFILNKIHEKFVFNMSFRYMKNTIYEQELLAIWYGVYLINVEGPKKKIYEMTRDMEKYFQVTLLSMHKLYPGYKGQGSTKKLISQTGADGFMELVDTKKSTSPSDSTF